MIINWGLVIFLIILWIVVAALSGLFYMDYRRYRGRLTYTESLARTILWPIIVPLLLVKGLMGTGHFIMEVISEIPEAFNDIWRWKS